MASKVPDVNAELNSEPGNFHKEGTAWSDATGNRVPESRLQEQAEQSNVLGGQLLLFSEGHDSQRYANISLHPATQLVKSTTLLALWHGSHEHSRHMWERHQCNQLDCCEEAWGNTALPFWAPAFLVGNGQWYLPTARISHMLLCKVARRRLFWPRQNAPGLQ